MTRGGSRSSLGAGLGLSIWLRVIVRVVVVVWGWGVGGVVVGGRALDPCHDQKMGDVVLFPLVLPKVWE